MARFCFLWSLNWNTSNTEFVTWTKLHAPIRQRSNIAVVFEQLCDSLSEWSPTQLLSFFPLISSVLCCSTPQLHVHAVIFTNKRSGIFSKSHKPDVGEAKRVYKSLTSPRSGLTRMLPDIWLLSKMNEEVFVQQGMWELCKNTQAEISTLLILISASLQVRQFVKPAKRASFASAVVVPWLRAARWLIYGICRVQRGRLTTSSIYSSGATTCLQSNNKLKSILYFRVRVRHAWHLIIISLLEDRNSYYCVDEAHLEYQLNLS